MCAKEKTVDDRMNATQLETFPDSNFPLFDSCLIEDVNDLDLHSSAN